MAKKGLTRQNLQVNPDGMTFGKTRRDRSWDAEHKDQVAHYRGIPPEVKREIINIAAELRVPVGQLARAFLEYGIEQYRSGALILEPKPKDDQTLY